MIRGTLLAACVTLLATTAHGATLQVLHTSAPSKVGAPRDLTIILPAGYNPRSTRRYPVLYLLDGQNLVSHPVHAGGWRADAGLDQAMKSGSEAMIIVGIHARDRMNEYTPVADPAHGGGGATQHVDHIVDDIIPFIDRSFATRATKQGRAIGGSSLGGLAAMHALLTRDQVFSRSLVMSPSVWWSNRALLGVVAASSTIGKQRIVLYNGGANDGRANAEDLRDLLHHKGLAWNRTLFHWTEPNASHDELAWASFFPRGLVQLFPQR